MKKIMFIFLSLSFLTVQAQKEAYRWYFGYNAGMDFSNTQTLASSNGLGNILGIPTAIKGPIYTREGCFSISDKDGNFLFASDGMTVYNKNLAVMENGTGLLGDMSSVNSGIVIPVPGDAYRYYLITAPDVAHTSYGIRYSIVDMRLNGGLGAVTSTKNILISYGTSGLTVSDTFENLTAVGHTNGEDFWLVTNMKGKYLAWKVTSGGFSEPVVSNAPYVPTGGQSSIRISPDGTKIAYADHSTLGGYLTTGDFNTLTGKATNLKYRAVGPDRLYGVDFSPSGKYLYITVLNMAAEQNGLYIRHINDLDVVPYPRRLPYISNIQIGPDLRMYAIAPDNNTSAPIRDLWVVLDPDNGGTKIASFSNFLLSGTVGVFGLPPFITSFFHIKPIVGKSLVCIGNSAEYSVEIPSIGTGTQQINYLEWNFGDGTPVVKDYNMSTSVSTYKQSHTYETEGLHTIKVTPYLVNGLPENSKVTTITSTVAECKIVTNRMIRTDLLPN